MAGQMTIDFTKDQAELLANLSQKTQAGKADLIMVGLKVLECMADGAQLLQPNDKGGWHQIHVDGISHLFTN
jgi:hypothetical protein